MNLPQLPVQSPVNSPKKKVIKTESDSAIEDLLGDIFVTKVVPGASLIDRLEKEFSTYRNEPVIPLRSNPLTWWKENERRFPLLSRVAKKYLCVQSTSVASERIFSTAGDIVIAQRASLTPENVDILIFLKKNLDINNI